MRVAHVLAEVMEKLGTDVAGVVPPRGPVSPTDVSLLVREVRPSAMSVEARSDLGFFDRFSTE